MAIKPDIPLQVGDWQYLPEQDKLVQFAADGKIAVTADLDNLSQKVLNYFMVNAGRLVTKDELLADVWGIRDVSDGRVTRVIRVLRVALDDDTREPKYIETIPKRGYRFVAAVSEIKATPEQDQPESIESAQQKKQHKLTRLLAAATVVMVTITAVSWLFYPTGEKHEAEQVIPLLRYTPVTSLDGLEFYHNMSEDERYLVYSYASPDNQNVTVLMLEDLKDHKRIQLTDDSYSSFGAAFNSDGTKIAYQRIYKGRNCEIRLIELDRKAFLPISDEIVTPCGKGAVSSRISWSPDGKYLVYPDMSSEDKQMSIQMLSMSSKSVEKLTNPPVSSFGDYSSRYSRKGDKVAFLREAAGAAQIWVVDLATRGTKLLVKIEDSFPGHIDWALDDSYIIYPSSSSSISKVSLDGDVKLLAYTDNISSEIQLTKSGKIVASAGSFSRINLRKLANSITNTESVDELVFSSNRNETFVEASPVANGPVAVISKRTGVPQVWLMYPNGTQRQLTHFSESERVRSLVFSPDGSKLLIQLNRQILIYNHYELIDHIDGADGAVIGIPSWSSSGERVLYPEVNQGKWQIISVSLSKLSEPSIIASEKEFYVESYNGKYVFWRDSNTKKFYAQVDGASPVLLNFMLPEAQISTKFQLTANGIYYAKLVGELTYGLFYYNLAEQREEIVIQEMRLSKFSISQDEKYIYILDYAFGDIDVAIISELVDSL